jgi:DNA-binding response OmpR family regulator
MTNRHGVHILVVDDDPKIRLLLRRLFEGEGFRVSEAGSGSDAENVAGSEQLDLITLDLGLPDADGFSVARAIRARSRVPIIMVTGKGEMIDRVVGLELGADDYITKPFHLREVLARVRAVLRRTETVAAASEPKQDGLYAFDRWLMNLPKRELKLKDGGVLPLTTAEFSLLEVLVRHPNRVLSRDQIMDMLKGHEWSPFDRSIDNLVAKLRKKIEADPDQPALLKTVRGVGYTFTVDVRQGG